MSTNPRDFNIVSGIPTSSSGTIIRTDLTGSYAEAVSDAFAAEGGLLSQGIPANISNVVVVGAVRGGYLSELSWCARSRDLRFIVRSLALLMTFAWAGLLSACAEESIVDANGEVYEFPSSNCPEGEIYAGVQPHLMCLTPRQYESLFVAKS